MFITIHSIAIIALFLAPLSLASPAIDGRQEQGCYSNDQKKFTLVAINQDAPYTEIPLALVSPRVGSKSIAWIGVSGTESTYTTISSNFIMVDGGLTAISTKGGTTGVSTDVVEKNGLLAFVPAEAVMMPVPKTKVYCEQTAEYSIPYILAMAAYGGDSSNFKLCEHTNGGGSALIYHVEGEVNIGEHNFGDCKQTTVYVNPE